MTVSAIPVDGAPAHKKVALVVAPHADDEVLGCGATVHGLRRAGYRTHLLLFTERTFPDPAGGPRRPDRDRALEETDAVCRLLNIEFSHHINATMRSLHHHFTEVVDAMEKVRDEQAPGLVFLPCGHDTHQEHQVVARAAQIVWRPHFLLAKGVQVLSYQTPSSYGFLPTHWQPVTQEAVDAKAAAMQCYASEVLPAPSTRCGEFIQVQAQYWGHIARSPTGLAEAFRLELGGSVPGLTKGE